MSSSDDSSSRSRAAPAAPTRVAAGFVSRRAVVAGMGALLTVAALVQLAWSAAVIFQPAEVMYGEAIIYDQSRRLLRGEPLYQPWDRPPYTVAAYTPLYYVMAAGLQWVFGPGFGPGRLLSLSAGLVSTGLVAYLATRRTGSPLAGAFAGLLFVALGLPGPPPWFALYKEDALALALSLGAMATLSGAPGLRRAALAGVLVALAALTKQTYVAACLAGGVWLWPHNRRGALVLVGVSLALVSGTALALEMGTGAFLANVLSANLNPFRFQALASNLAVLYVFQVGPLVTAGLYLLAQKRTKQELARDLLVCFWGASLLPLAGLAKLGSNHNYWMELAAATSVLATAYVWAYLGQRESSDWTGTIRPSILLLGTNIAWVTVFLIVITLPLPSLLARAPGRIDEFGRVVELVRTEPGQVLADPMDVIVLADRTILLEPYLFSILQREGQWDPAPVVHYICTGQVGLLVLDRELESDRPKYHGYPGWPAPVLAALRERMVLKANQAGRFIYEPRDASLIDGCWAVETRSAAESWGRLAPAGSDGSLAKRRLTD